MAVARLAAAAPARLLLYEAQLTVPGGLIPPTRLIHNTVTRNNIWHLWRPWEAFYDEGTDNDFAFDMYNGNPGAPITGGIQATPFYASGHGWQSESGGLYQLQPGTPGFNQGTRIANFNDAFIGAAPDIGAHEGGSAAMAFGLTASPGPAVPGYRPTTSTPPAIFTLGVSKTGTGSGTVTSSPAGTACGSTCAANFSSGTSVTLSAAPASESTFAGWSGGECSGTGGCTVTMSAAKAVTATFAAQSTNPPRLVNIATRMQVGTADNVLIGGFVISGSINKTVVVRARGPSLAAQGVPGTLQDPVLQIFSGQTQIAANDNWQSGTNQSSLQSSGFAPGDPREAALYIALGPGAYTAIVSGAGGTTGVGLIEVFEVDAFAAPLVNIATRGQVLTGDNVMIGGFIIQGDGPQTVVLRARGPSLAAQGVANTLADPRLQLFSGQTVIASNDDWRTAVNSAELQASGFAPADDRESAILVTLNPGAYTAIVSGKSGSTGIGIIEVFAR